MTTDPRAIVFGEMATALAEIAELVGLPRDVDEPELIVERARLMREQWWNDGYDAGVVAVAR